MYVNVDVATNRKHVLNMNMFIDDALDKSSHGLTLIMYEPYHPTDVFTVSFLPVSDGARHLRSCVSFSN